jgi:uncharacterized protein
MSIEERIAGLDWDRLTDDIDRQGWATTDPLLSEDERLALAGAYDDEQLYRSRVVMARHGFGQGEYSYYAYPLPPLIQQLRERLYERLVPLANRWRVALGQSDQFPPEHADYLERCRAAGQSRPTPLILRYGPGDYNCLHQDLYGELNFPLQAAFLLSEPGKDFAGGELVLTEQRPRMQSKAQVVPMQAGEAVIFAVNHRPVQGSRGTYRVAMRHGVSTVRSGSRHTLGIILHDAA